MVASGLLRIRCHVCLMIGLLIGLTLQRSTGGALNRYRMLLRAAWPAALALKPGELEPRGLTVSTKRLRQQQEQNLTMIVAQRLAMV